MVQCVSLFQISLVKKFLMLTYEPLTFMLFESNMKRSSLKQHPLSLQLDTVRAIPYISVQEKK